MAFNFYEMDPWTRLVLLNNPRKISQNTKYFSLMTSFMNVSYLKMFGGIKGNKLSSKLWHALMNIGGSPLFVWRHLWMSFTLNCFEESRALNWVSASMASSRVLKNCCWNRKISWMLPNRELQLLKTKTTHLKTA